MDIRLATYSAHRGLLLLVVDYILTYLPSISHGFAPGLPSVSVTHTKNFHFATCMRTAIAKFQANFIQLVGAQHPLQSTTTLRNALW